MKNWMFLLIGLIFFSFSGKSQEKSKLESFSNLIGGKWLTDGEWSNGTKFKQEVNYEWALGQKLIKVKTFGIINRETNEYGLRNEGIRVWNTQDSVIQFWEFDIYGGITTGICYFTKKDLNYEYEYHGEQLRETWVYIDEKTYQYKVGSVVNGQLKKLYLESTYTRIQF